MSEVRVKAALLKDFKSPLEITEVSIPTPGAGEALVTLQTTAIPFYTDEVISGVRPNGIVPPIVPGFGGVGVIRLVGQDATRLNVEDLVYIDTTVTSRDDSIAPDVLLQGWIAFSPGAHKMASRYHHGSFAKGILVPLENVFKIPATLVEKWGVQKLSWIGVLLVAYGQIKGANIQPGATVLVTPATGFFSSLVVVIALALGASKVIATGRTQSKLDHLVSKINNPRLSTYKYTGDVQADVGALSSKYPDISVAIDLLPSGTTDTSTTLAALLSLRTGGTLVLGGGASGFNVPYPAVLYKSLTIKGQMMYEKKWIPELINLLDAGVVDLGLLEEKTWSLDNINEGIKGARDFEGPYKLATLNLKD